MSLINDLKISTKMTLLYLIPSLAAVLSLLSTLRINSENALFPTIILLLGIVLGYSIRNSILKSVMDLNNDLVNLNLLHDNTIQSAKNDLSAIIAIEKIAEQASLGFVSVRVHAEAGSQELKNAITSINRMFEAFEDIFSQANSILVSYSRSNYTINVTVGQYGGEVGGLLLSLKALGESTGDFIALISNNGKELSSGSQVLNISSESLSTSANEQAASLEQTAAAVEELTSNISANSQKATEMASLARETEQAANDGKSLADTTVLSMNEISKATQSINEAVSIIENIAFQTNILSLNAAVEAATAGDAGKGFAVVAQEVRNLANRSAEAAQQIKVLAELANTKSKDGLQISENMMKGFDLINHKISLTTELVQDVANGSREQMIGINQINTAVSQLDQITQQNAQNANEVTSLAGGILTLAETLNDIASKTTFYPESCNRVCQVDMMFDTTKLKLDHVIFKNTNFGKLKEQNIKSWIVTNETQCALGKWIQEHSNESYAQGKEWKELLANHTHIHRKVQEFVNLKTSGKLSNHEIKVLSLEIEQDTAYVFNALNLIRALACKKNSL